MTQSDEVAKLAREDDIVEMEDERAFCVIILRLLGVDETDGQVNRIAPPAHELFRSRRAWRDLAKSRTKENVAKDAQLTAIAAEVDEYRLLLLEARSVCQSHQVTSIRFEEKLNAALQPKGSKP